MNHTDYYVYAHRDLSGIVFYVGMGQKNRAYRKDRRSQAWVDKHLQGYTVEILHENLSKKDALSIELDYINNPRSDWCLINVSKNTETIELNREFFSKYFYYDATSPTGLRWKIDRIIGKNKVIRKGTPAGSIRVSSPDYYRCLMLHGKGYLVHRIVYTLCHGEIPYGYVVNHIDNNRHNNNIENLEICTIAENNRKAKTHGGICRSDNKSGVTGVHLSVNSANNRFWVATWRDIGENKRQKCFSVLKHGESEAFRLACEYRKQMIEKLNSEGAGYSVVE